MTKKTKKIIIISSAAAVALAAAAGITLGVLFGGHVHNIELVEREKAATCTEDGNTACYYCPDCGKYFADFAGENEIDPADTVIAATGHDLVRVEASSATCTEDGNIAYWYCENCQTAFADEDAATALADEQLVVPATGHDWDVGEVTTPPECLKEGERTFTCSRCGEHKYESVAALTHEYSVTNADELFHWLQCVHCEEEEEGSREYHDFVTDGSADGCGHCDARLTFSEGLEFTYSADLGGYVLAGAGTFGGRNLFVPESYDDGEHGRLDVVAVAEGAFERNISLSVVRLPDGVKEIGANAFFYCSNLSVLTLSEGLESIGDDAFYGCSDLESVVIPASVRSVGCQAFTESGLASAIFIQPLGWTAGGVVADLSDPAEAARFLLSCEEALLRDQN